MAAITGAVIGGVSALGGVYQAIQGSKQARDAQSALNNLPIPELQNSYSGMQVSKMGNELVSEQNQNRFAQTVDALRTGGVRGIIGGLGQASAMAKQTDLEIKANYDKQENEIAMAQAQDQGVIRAMREQRYQGNVSALSSQISAGRQQEMQGIHGAMQGLASGVQMYQQGQYMDALTGKVKNLGVNAKPLPKLQTTGIISQGAQLPGPGNVSSILAGNAAGAATLQNYNNYNQSVQNIFGQGNPFTSFPSFGQGNPFSVVPQYPNAGP